MNLLSSLLKYTADQIAALRAKNTSQDDTVSGINNRLTTAEGDIDSLEAQFTTVVSAVTTDTEVTNIRVGEDGVTYATAGEAVRSQFSNVKDNLWGNTKSYIYKFLNNKYIDTSGTTANINSPASATGYRVCVADCVEGDAFYITARGSNIANTWAFVQSNGTIISKASNNDYVNNYKIVAPANSAYLIVNATSSVTNPKCYKGIPLVNRVSANEAIITAHSNDIGAMKTAEQRGNIFEAKTDFLTGKYYYRSGSSLVTATNASYNGFIIPVVPHSQYKFIQSNIVLLDADKKPLAGSSSWDYQAVTSCNSGDAEFFAVTYLTSIVPTEGYAITMGGAVSYDPYSYIVYAKSDYMLRNRTAKVVRGSISDGGNLALTGASAIKDGQQIVFRGKFAAFSEVTINFKTSQNYVKVTSSNVVICNTSNNTISVAHGLALANDICILLELKKSKMYVSITSMGVTYKYDCDWNQADAANTYYSAEPSGMSFTEATLSSNYSACKRKVWYFGDSYIAFGSNTRLPYYMMQYGFDENVAFSGPSGGTMGNALGAFTTMLNYGKPSIAILAAGMNNGSDSSSAPSATWLSGVTQFLGMCETYGIEPILCTVPTVPSVNNEKKNEYVRNSGYRYVDFAKAVGADSSGVWYTGMLSNDAVHPSALGGNALFTQLITDAPEVMG